MNQRNVILKQLRAIAKNDVTGIVRYEQDGEKKTDRVNPQDAKILIQIMVEEMCDE